MERAHSGIYGSAKPVLSKRPARTAAVAIKTGHACGSAHHVDIVEIAGQPTYAELKQADQESLRLADELFDELTASRIPWEDEELPVSFGEHLGGGRYASVTFGKHVFELGDHVFLKLEFKERQGPGSGVGGIGWFATIREIRRNLSCVYEWFEVAKAEEALSSFGQYRELFRLEGDGASDKGCLTSIRRGVSVSFPDKPVENADFFCRASVRKGDGYKTETAYTLLDHLANPAPPLNHPPTVLELFAGTGLPGSALEDAGCKAKWAVEWDPVVATTQALNTDSNVLNIDLYTFIKHSAALISGTAPARLSDEGLGTRLGNKSKQKGYYEAADFPQSRAADVM